MTPLSEITEVVDDIIHAAKSQPADDASATLDRVIELAEAVRMLVASIRPACGGDQE